MMFLLTCDKKLTKSQLSPTHASTERKITDELKHNAGWYEGLLFVVCWYYYSSSIITIILINVIADALLRYLRYCSFDY